MTVPAQTVLTSARLLSPASIVSATMIGRALLQTV
jgi:hypothetical protein